MLIKTSFRCSEAERKELSQYAKANNKTLSEYVRLRLLAPETVQGKIALHEAVININTQMDIIAQNLEENQKTLTAILNTLFQFMAEDIGQDKTKEIFTKIKTRMENENHDQ